MAKILIKELSDLILRTLHVDDSIVNYLPEDKHNFTLEEGVPATIGWVRSVYAQ